MFNLTVPQLLAQGIAIIIIILMAIGAHAKTQKMFLFFQIITNILYALHYALLSSNIAVAFAIICAVRTLIFFLYRRANKDIPAWLLVTIFAAVIGSGLITWSGWLDIIPIISTVAFTYGQWQHNIQTTRRTVIMGDIGWAIYNLSCLAYIDLIGKAVEITSCSIALYKNRKLHNTGV